MFYISVLTLKSAIKKGLNTYGTTLTFICLLYVIYIHIVIFLHTDSDIGRQTRYMKEAVQQPYDHTQHGLMICKILYTSNVFKQEYNMQKSQNKHLAKIPFFSNAQII